MAMIKECCSWRCQYKWRTSFAHYEIYASCPLFYPNFEVYDHIPNQAIMSQDSRSYLVFVVTTLSVVTSFLFVLLRLVARITILRSPSWDDFFIVLAWVATYYLITKLKSAKRTSGFGLWALIFDMLCHPSWSWEPRCEHTSGIA